MSLSTGRTAIGSSRELTWSGVAFRTVSVARAAGLFAPSIRITGDSIHVRGIDQLENQFMAGLIDTSRCIQSILAFQYFSVARQR